MVSTRQALDQRLDPGDRAEIRRPHVAVGDFKVKLGFDRQHKINEVKRRQSVLAEIVVAANEPVDRPLGEERLHQSVNAFAYIESIAIKHAEISRKSAVRGADFFDDIISLTEGESSDITILRVAGIRAVTLMGKKRANCS